MGVHLSHLLSSCVGAGRDVPDGEVGHVVLNGSLVNKQDSISGRRGSELTYTSAKSVDSNFEGYIDTAGLLCIVPKREPYLYNEDQGSDSIHCVEIESMLLDLQQMYHVLAFPLLLQKTSYETPGVAIVAQLHQKNHESISKQQLQHIRLHMTRKGA